MLSTNYCNQRNFIACAPDEHIVENHTVNAFLDSYAFVRIARNTSPVNPYIQLLNIIIIISNLLLHTL